jgi:hypothetical protein
MAASGYHGAARKSNNGRSRARADPFERRAVAVCQQNAGDV